MAKNGKERAQETLKRTTDYLNNMESSIDGLRSVIMGDDGAPRELPVEKLLTELVRFNIIMGDITVDTLRSSVSDLKEAVDEEYGENQDSAEDDVVEKKGILGVILCNCGKELDVYGSGDDTNDDDDDDDDGDDWKNKQQ